LKKTVGIDIGGTKIAGVLIDANDQILREAKVPTPASDGQAIIAAVIAMIKDLSEGQDVLVAGVAAAGFIDASQSEVRYAPNLNWRNEPLKAKLESALGIQVFIENDANAAGWAEYRFGAGRHYRNMVMLTVGTGVGGAIVVDGKMFRGGFGIGAELGHMNLIPEGKLCGCGQHGCLEQYGSGTALLNRAKELISSGQAKNSMLGSKSAADLSGNDIFTALQANDELALGLLNELGHYLGQAIASLTAILDPEVVVIGGGVSILGEKLLAPIRDAYLEHLPARGFRPELALVSAELVNDAGAIGAADLAREHSSAR
jgi:glucokinase